MEMTAAIDTGRDCANSSGLLCSFKRPISSMHFDMRTHACASCKRARVQSSATSAGTDTPDLAPELEEGRRDCATHAASAVVSCRAVVQPLPMLAECACAESPMRTQRPLPSLLHLMKFAVLRIKFTESEHFQGVSLIVFEPQPSVSATHACARKFKPHVAWYQYARNRLKNSGAQHQVSGENTRGTEGGRT